MLWKVQIATVFKIVHLSNRNFNRIKCHGNIQRNYLNRSSSHMLVFHELTTSLFLCNFQMFYWREKVNYCARSLWDESNGWPCSRQLDDPHLVLPDSDGTCVIVVYYKIRILLNLLSDHTHPLLRLVLLWRC